MPRFFRFSYSFSQEIELDETKEKKSKFAQANDKWVSTSITITIPHHTTRMSTNIVAYHTSHMAHLHAQNIKYLFFYEKRIKNETTEKTKIWMK